MSAISDTVNETLYDAGGKAIREKRCEEAIEKLSKLKERLEKEERYKEIPLYGHTLERLNQAKLCLHEVGLKALEERECEEAVKKFTKLKEYDPLYPNVNELLSRAQKQCNPSKWPIVAIILVLLAVVGTAIYFIVVPEGTSGGDSTEEPTTEPTAEVTLLTTEPTEEPTSASTTTEPTEEPTVEPPEEPTEAVTEESTVEPTEESTEEPTAEPTVTPTEEPTPTPTEEPTPTPTEEPTEQTAGRSNEIDPTTLPGKIAVPIFNLQTQTYNLYIVSGPDWQIPAQPFQTAASQPAFSPDGSQIVFRSWGGEAAAYQEQLVIRLASGAGERFVARTIEDARPQWSGNAPVDILLHSRPAGLSTRVYLQGIWDGALDDPNARRDLAVGENPTWLPDGRIVYASGESEGIGLYVMPGDGGNIQKIWSSSVIVAPQGSPNSNQVVFSFNDDLYLLPVGNGLSEATPLLSTPGERERLPVWSPNGEYIAYVGDQMNESWALYVMRADGTGKIKLTDLAGPIEGRPANVPQERAFGWFEEQLAWGR